MEKNKTKSIPFASGLLVGASVSAAAAFLYKTKKGKKIKKVLNAYYLEAKEHLEELIKDVKEQAKTKALPQVVDQVAQKEIKAVKKKIKTIRKNVFLQSGKPLVR